MVLWGLEIFDCYVAMEVRFEKWLENYTWAAPSEVEQLEHDQW